MNTRPWRHALGLVGAAPATFALSLAAYVAFFGLFLASGLLGREVFDALRGHPTLLGVWVLIALMVAAEFARVLLLFVGGWNFNIFRYAAEAMLRTNMLAWLVAAPGARVLPGSAGDLVSRFRDDVAETTGLATISIVSPQIISGLAVMGIMLALNWQVALGVLATLAATLVLTAWMGRAIAATRAASRAAAAQVTSFLGETFGAVQAVKLSGAEGRLTAHLGALNGRRRDAAIRDRLASGLLEGLSLNINALGVGLVLLLSARAMRAGDFTVGDFVLFASYLPTATAAPRLIGSILTVRRQAAVSIGRIRTLMPDAPPLALVAREPARPAPPPAAEPLRSLRITGLTCRHPGSGRGVAGIDLALEAGGFTVITGQVGSGKTTLVRALLGLIPIQAGEIAWNGEMVADPSAFMIPPRCAYTPQAPRLFSETLADNILMGWPASPDDLAAAVDLAVLGPDAARLDKGLETPVGTRGVTLSGGQVQRAAAARMFVRRPELLVFDDVSSALDVATERQLWRGLFDGGGVRTCLAVSHRRAAFQRADQILVLEEGRVAARGDLARLLADSPAFQQIWRESE